VAGRALNPGHVMETGKGGILAMPITFPKKSLITTDMTIYITAKIRTSYGIGSVTYLKSLKKGLFVCGDKKDWVKAGCGNSARPV
jgi:hypothetical protein